MPDTNRAGVIAGLRQLADLFESNPDLPLPYDLTSGQSGLAFLSLTTDGPAARTDLANWSRILPGPWRKEYAGTYFRMHGHVGAIPVYLCAFRNAVCTRVVVGTHEKTRTVPAPDAPTVEVTETIEDVEWRCVPLLAGVDTDTTQEATP